MTPNNNGQVDGNRNNRRPWNNRNCNSDSSPNRGDNSFNNQGLQIIIGMLIKDMVIDPI